jgi:hypothetical protein
MEVVFELTALSGAGASRTVFLVIAHNMLFAMTIKLPPGMNSWTVTRHQLGDLLGQWSPVNGRSESLPATSGQ